MDAEYGLAVTIGLPFEEAVARTRLVLRSRGFSILSEMPGVPTPDRSGKSHLFMTLWTRVIAAGNLGGEGLDVGDHLACNVVVYADGRATQVVVLDPEEGLEGWADPGLAAEASGSLTELLEEIASVGQ